MNAISFITELELLAYPDLSKESNRIIKGLLSNCLIVDINNIIKNLTIDFRKNSKLKLPDSIIAATAYHHRLPLLTADKIFKTVDDLEVILYEN